MNLKCGGSGADRQAGTALGQGTASAAPDGFVLDARLLVGLLEKGNIFLRGGRRPLPG